VRYVPDVSTGRPREPEDFEIEFDEELEEQWLAEWDGADRNAVEAVRNALREHRGQPAPTDLLRDAAVSVRARLREGGHPLDWVGQAAGLSDDPVAEDDAELLIRLAAATISPQEETGLDVEEAALLLSLEHADWLGAIVSVVRDGPGADASPSALVAGIRDCPEVEHGTDFDIDDESHLDAAFWIVALPWQALGLIDRDQRLTGLGEWILPRALGRAWGGDFDQKPEERQG
jgi:hypothetical protein